MKKLFTFAAKTIALSAILSSAIHAADMEPMRPEFSQALAVVCVTVRSSDHNALYEMVRYRMFDYLTDEEQWIFNEITNDLLKPNWQAGATSASDQEMDFYRNKVEKTLDTATKAGLMIKAEKYFTQ